jgi:hypothetical protein
MDISGLKARLLISQKPGFWEVVKSVEKEHHEKTVRTKSPALESGRYPRHFCSTGGLTCIN